MPTYISMLRGINLGSHNSIRMPELKGLYEALGFTNVSTYVQSGNVVFSGDDRDTPELEAAIQAQIAATFGFDVPVFVRQARDFQWLLDENPFLHGRSEDPARLHVTFLSAAPPQEKLDALVKPAGENDEYVIIGRDVFLFCPNGYGRTKLSNAFFERKLGLPATTRNWNTINALLKMANSLPS
jgi:uncharacterized protein (DUF1697 family)